MIKVGWENLCKDILELCIIWQCNLSSKFYSLNVPLRDGIDDQGRLGEFM